MYQIIRELESDNSRLVKEAIIKREAQANNQILFEGFTMGLDNLYTFGVKKVPKHSGPDGQGLPWPAFRQLATSLYKRELTGNAAREAIELALTVATEAEWNDWYRRILIKDLRCGVSEKTVNKCLKGTKIKPVPVFECQLAHDGANYENKFVGPKLLEPKLDGVRVLTFVNCENGTVTQYSRNGKVLENFTHITESLVPFINKTFTKSIVLDGEMVSTSFQALMKQVHRKENVKADDAVLMVFDYITLEDFNKGLGTETQAERRENLEFWNKTVFSKLDNVSLVPQRSVNLDTFEGQMDFKEYNKQAVDDGFEGIMVKDPDAVYECKRTTNWLKMKPFIEVSLTIVKVEEGTGRNAGRMGALICEGEDDGKTIKVNVGSGFSDTDRTEIWQDIDNVINQVIEVRADAITKSQDSEDYYSLRFPRFLRFRGFNVGEKL
jgi:DNA ligase 1